MTLMQLQHSMRNSYTPPLSTTGGQGNRTPDSDRPDSQTIVAQGENVTVDQEAFLEIDTASQRPGLQTGKILHAFVAHQDDEVTVAADDEVLILDKTKSEEWWEVQRVKNGKRGWVPAPYVKIISVGKLQLGRVREQLAMHSSLTRDDATGIQYPPVNPADQNPPSNILYVGNLPPNTSKDELKAMFSKQRGYNRLHFHTKQNGPMCFAEFEDVSFATKALNELYGHPLHNSIRGGIRLSFCKNPLGAQSEQLYGTKSDPAAHVLDKVSRVGTLDHGHFKPNRQRDSDARLGSIPRSSAAFRDDLNARDMPPRRQEYEVHAQTSLQNTGATTFNTLDAKESFLLSEFESAHDYESVKSASPNESEMAQWGSQSEDGTWRCAYPGCTSRSRFSRGCDLRKHYKRHTKLLFCRYDGCPQATEGGFADKKTRARHEAKHNPDIPCEWEGCDRLFSRVDNMVR